MPTHFFFMDLDWPKVWESILGTVGSGFALWWLGRRAQKWRETVDTRTGDQKNIDQLLGRVTTLETQMTAANTKIEELRTEKMELQVQIVLLREQIALLEVKKAEFESRETIFQAQIASLQELLAAKTSELRCVEERMAKMERERQE